MVAPQVVVLSGGDDGPYVPSQHHSRRNLVVHDESEGNALWHDVLVVEPVPPGSLPLLESPDMGQPPAVQALLGREAEVVPAPGQVGTDAPIGPSQVLPAVVVLMVHVPEPVFDPRPVHIFPEGLTGDETLAIKRYGGLDRGDRFRKLGRFPVPGRVGNERIWVEVAQDSPITVRAKLPRPQSTLAPTPE